MSRWWTAATRREIVARIEGAGMWPVLVIGDADADNADVPAHVRRAGYECLSLAPAPAAPVLESHECSLVLIGAGVSVDQLLAWRRRLAGVPCVVLTGESPWLSGEKGLQAGADGLLPWTNLESDLVSTLQIYLESPETTDPTREVLSYTIENHSELIPLIVAAVRQRIEKWQFEDPIELERVTVALTEALDNALFHGNLDLCSDLRQGSGQAWRGESLIRRTALPYRDRRVRFQAVIDAQGAEFNVRDEGAGFDPNLLNDCTQIDNLERCSGRGLLMMKIYMDDIRFNAVGNEITMKKLRPATLPATR